MTILRRMLPKVNKLQILLILVLVGCFKVTEAQQYNWQSSVATPKQQGYHSILLSPEVIGRLKADLSDIRLYSGGKEVPYLLRAEEPVQYKRLFKNYDIVSYTHQKGCCSELLISNPEKRKLNNISLLISNADARKQVKLSGSDNRQDWYVLKEKDILYAINNRASTAEVKLLDFPLSNYRYFRLQLNDSASAPLNILQAGYYDTYTEAGKHIEIPIREFTRKDSLSTKSSYIHVRFAHPVYPERLEFTISSPQLYYRHGQIILGAPAPEKRRRSKRRKQRQQPRPAVSFVLNSNAPAIVELPRQKLRELTIVIQNDDNQPLEITGLIALQLNRYLVAELSPDQEYTLLFGDSTAKAPAYELEYFQDSIPAKLPVVQTGELQQLQPVKKEKNKTSTILIWSAIAVVVAGLSYMTVKLLNEMDKKKQA
ncbi:hypothetical protein [Pontibacter burrus]|uniref:DUF3999 domain-containing protein n=1 Tax=Pontibacter burrus TaxID=2704466 RepID=A0A6B3LSH5_9BACT|nr:hypothetical protein [Pontibacter burrus]NEM96928.1 hypothetical protein [Pontibacter burrus]